MIDKVEKTATMGNARGQQNMISIDFPTLNELEIRIHERLQNASKELPTLRITEAATLCGCSVSKISKFTKKLGFTNFKQYVDFLYNKDIKIKTPSLELDRLQKFITDFDEKLVDEMIGLIAGHERIVLFGYGPSLLCAQYIEYRLRTASPKVIIAVVDDLSVASMTDASTLLLIFTVTGSYRDFTSMYNTASKKKAKVVIVAQHFNASLITQCDKIFFLTDTPNSEDMVPYEQSRTLFFIFMEEVIQRIARDNKTLQESSLK
jgi:DNA-binding MurR/RpiR family transcriptional regulator